MSPAGVTRPNRPGIDLSKQPPAVRLNKELGFVLTFKLKVMFYPSHVFLFIHFGIRIRSFVEEKYHLLVACKLVTEFQSTELHFLGPAINCVTRIDITRTLTCMYFFVIFY